MFLLNAKNCLSTICPEVFCVSGENLLIKLHLQTSMGISTLVSDLEDDVYKFLVQANSELKDSIDTFLEFNKVDSKYEINLTLKSNLFPKAVERFGKDFGIKAELEIMPLNRQDYLGSPITISTGVMTVQKAGEGADEYECLFQDNKEYAAVEWLQGDRVCSSVQVWLFTKEPGDAWEINRKILSQKIATDASILASNGVVVKCHKSFLIAHSPVFKDMFANGEGETDVVVDMSKTSEPGVASFLEYLYHWDLKGAKSSCEIAIELLKAGDCYKILRLTKTIAEILLGKPMAWYSVTGALELFLFSDQKDLPRLKIKALEALETKCEELEMNPTYQTIFQENQAIAMKLCKLAFSFKSLGKPVSEAFKPKNPDASPPKENLIVEASVLSSAKENMLEEAGVSSPEKQNVIVEAGVLSPEKENLIVEARVLSPLKENVIVKASVSSPEKQNVIVEASVLSPAKEKMLEEAGVFTSRRRQKTSNVDLSFLRDNPGAPNGGQA